MEKPFSVQFQASRLRRIGVLLAERGAPGHRSLIGLALCALFALAACKSTTTDPNPELEMSRGALVGGACTTNANCGGGLDQVCSSAVCVCANGYFGNAGATTCAHCDSSCATCSGPTADDCTSCGAGAQLAAAVGDSCTVNADCALLSVASSSGGVCTAGKCALSSCQTGHFVNGSLCTACTAISGCSAGLTCTTASNQQCGTCASETYLIHGAAGTADTCAPCTSACGAGHFEATACAGSNNRVCASCTLIPACTAGLTCTTASNQQCTACASESYLVQGTNGAADSCTTCTGACGAGTFESVSCTSAANRVCSSCTAINNCTAGLTCSTASDQQCTTCATGTYLVKGASGAPDTCAACSCPADSCHPGTCDAAGVCHVAANGTACDDHSLCTIGDSCTSGVCAGAPVACPSGDCHPGVCNPTSGTCTVSPDGTACTADSNPCTVDLCAVGVCAHGAGNPGVACSASSCSAGVGTLAASCDGVGTTCPSAATQICAPGICAGTACRSACTADGDCAATAFCHGGTCATKLADHAACTASAQCQSSHCIDGACNVGDRLVVAPNTSPVPPRGAATFSVTGGSGTGLIFAVSTNLSGGAIDAGGHYTAGQNDNVTDVVTVTDSFGNVATASIVVGAGVDVLPHGPTAPPRGALSFAASGGSGLPFVYALRTNASGGTLDVHTGAYVAGVKPDVIDVVAATDTLGNVAVTNVSVGDGVTVSPTSAAIPPHGSLALTASGGSATGFVFVLTTNASGGHVDANTGAYVAGAAPHTTDLVTATDSLGNAGTTAISVGGGVAVQPSSFVTPPLGSGTFVASGGGSTFTFAFLTNASGGSVDSLTGAYKAGLRGSVTDLLQVSDALGSGTTVNITVGPGLTLSPTAPSVAPLGHRALSVSGGAGSGYAFALTTAASGGHVDASTGEYVAGAVGAVTDVVTATDLLGNRATASVTVTAALGAISIPISVPPRGVATVTAAGGAPPYVFALTTNGSVGAIDPTSGDYTAGATTGTTDVVAVSDQNGATTSVVIAVGAGVSIAPASPVVAPLQSLPFGCTGGSGAGYVYALTTNASGGTIVAATGAYTAGATGGVADVVTATDALGNTDTVTISVGGGLVVNASATTVAPRGGLTLTATGGSGTGYLYALTTNASGGSIDGATGAYLAGDTGDVTDVVTVSDSLGNSTTASIPIGPGLAVTPSVAATAPSGSLALTVSGGSGSDYQFALTSNQSLGFIDGTGIYEAGIVGDVTDVVTVTDSLGNHATVTISVSGGLTLTASATSVPPRGFATFTPAGGSGGGFTFVIRGNGSGGSINATTGAYLAGELPNSRDVIEVSDAFGNRATLPITVGPGLTVTPAAPAAPPLGALTFVATGGSGSGYQFAFTGDASGGTLGATTGLYTAGSTTDVVDVVTVSDSLGNTLTINVAVGGALTVNPPAPDVAPRGGLQLVAAGGSHSGYIFTFTTNASGGIVDPGSGAYRAGAVGNVVDIVTVTDDLGNSAHATITVGNRVQLSPLSTSVAPLGGVRFTIAGGSGSGYTFVLAANGSSASIDAQTGAYLAGVVGGTTDTVTVTDSLGNTATGTVHVGASLRVTAPLGATAPRASVSLVVSGGAADVSFTVSTNRSGGRINPATGVYTAGPTGATTDVITARDSNGATAIVAITVGAGIQIAPVAGGAHVATRMTLTATGGSGKGYIWTLVSAGSGGTIEAATGSYLPGPHVGTDAVQVSDSLGNTADLEIPVSVAPKPGGGGGCEFAAASGSAAGSGLVLVCLMFAVSSIRRRRRTLSSRAV